MAGDEPMGEIPSESSRDPNLGSESLDEEKKLEDEKCLEECLKLSVVTEEVSGRVLAENGFLSLEEGSPKRSIEIDERCILMCPLLRLF
uniref:Uncharacterized protein n=1 Tax=Cajanus cajan TaxID=3821 RepID=A0A151T036_CAJCA|nr:hypothetical protein KK1_022829 [Cajanus cajan]